MPSVASFLCENIQFFFQYEMSSKLEIIFGIHTRPVANPLYVILLENQR
jgi:hypothetical protein